MGDPITTGAAILAGGSLVGAGVSMLNLNQPSSPTMQKYKPTNYIAYDSDGNVLGSYSWDSSTNTYTYKARERTEQDKADNQALADLKSTLIKNLSETPEDRLAAYEEYAKTFSDAMHTDVDRQFAKTMTSAEETMNARGMLGSKAYADIVGDLNKSKLDADTEIAQKATLAKETLANTDKTYWANMLNAIESNNRADYLAELQGSSTAASNTSAANAVQAGSTASANSASLSKWQTELQANQALTQNLMDTSTGLAFLYGMGG